MEVILAYPVVVNVSINPTLHSELPIWAQYLASLSGLSGIVAFLALALSQRRRPVIKCADIRYLLIGNTTQLNESSENDGGAFINPQLTFSNVGNRAGTIETLKIELEDERGFAYDYVPYIDEMKLKYLEEENGLIPYAYNCPVHSFTIASGAGVSKSILFVCSGFKFVKSKRILINQQILQQ